MLSSCFSPLIWLSSASLTPLMSCPSSPNVGHKTSAWGIRSTECPLSRCVVFQTSPSKFWSPMFSVFSKMENSKILNMTVDGTRVRTHFCWWLFFSMVLRPKLVTIPPPWEKTRLLSFCGKFYIFTSFLLKNAFWLRLYWELDPLVPSRLWTVRSLRWRSFLVVFGSQSSETRQQQRKIKRAKDCGRKTLLFPLCYYYY